MSEGIDGLLQQENRELADRVADLEKKVVGQTDEIACLKSAMADCLRRLHAMESNKGGGTGSGASARTTVSSTHQPRRSNAMPNSSQTTTPRTPMSANSTRASLTSATPTPATPRTGGGGGGGAGGRIQPTTASTQNSAPARPTTAAKGGRGSESTGIKEPVFIKDEGILRTFLRGRPISSHIPSSYIDYDVKAGLDAPEEKLKMEWVYGYRGRDCRNNVHFLPTGEVVYFIASVVVLYNIEEQMQRHYLGHNDDVKCIAIHPDRITIATGQVAGRDHSHGKPHVRIWNSVNLNTLHILGLNDLERAVACVAFSKADGGDRLAIIDESNEHVISVWDWQNETKITETKSSSDPVIAVEFHPLDKENLVSCGKNHLAFWTLEGCQLSKKMAIYEKYEKPKFVLSLTFAENGDLITGDSSGTIHIWKRGSNKVSQCIANAHDGGIFALCITRESQLVSGGGKDRRIVLWDSAFNPSGQEITLDESYGAVRTLAQGPGGMMLVGTTWNHILQGNLSLDFSVIVGGGHTDELWGLSCRPSGELQFLTGSYDRRVVLWDALTHQAVWSREISDPVHCASFHRDGRVVALGTRTGRWLVLDVTTREILAAHTDGNEQIECVEFSPDGNNLALGSRDNCLYVYSCQEGGTKFIRIGKCCGHSSYVTHLDWSADSQYLRSTSGDYELLYWTASNCRQVLSSSTMCELQWATQNCVLGYETVGIWPEGSDGTDVNACSKSHKQQLLASGDDFGLVKLFRYPTCQVKAKFHSFGGHSSHVTNVKFLKDDSRLISCGGKDAAVIQWEVL